MAGGSKNYIGLGSVVCEECHTLLAHGKAYSRVK